ncbi:MAG: MvaI/BcnI family restriction endonuclease [Candidatus Limimorpha sp.]
MTNKEKIISKFRAVKKMGYVKSHRSSNTGIGKTFEDYVGVVENNADKPDLFGFEIKTHREIAQSYVTLFTKSPSFPKSANTYLRNKFGVRCAENPELKKLHTSMFANKANTFAGKYAFKLINDKNDKCIYLAVYSLKTKVMIDCECGYTYDDLKKVLNKKLKNLFYVTADIKKDNSNTEYFFFNKADIYEKPSFDNFLSLLDNGLIMYDIRIGSYMSGSNYGKAHDHGSGFRIKDNDLIKLYSVHEKIE